MPAYPIVCGACGAALGSAQTLEAAELLLMEHDKKHHPEGF